MTDRLIFRTLLIHRPCLSVPVRQSLSRRKVRLYRSAGCHHQWWLQIARV